MNHAAKSIRAFIGASNFETSRKFYNDLGFTETVLSKNMSLFTVSDNFGFYLQDAFVEEWINNSMLFLEVGNLDDHLKQLQALQLPQRYPSVKVTSIRTEDWGREYFMHDPSGVLWHFGEFKK